MNVVQLEHLIRAAGALLGENTVIVVGSQAILATDPTVDDALLTRSMEADLLPLDDPSGDKADLIDGVLGAGSSFDELHGFHGDGVGERTVLLPEGWRRRLIVLVNDNTNGVRGLCLEANDLVVSKLAAGRQKDLEFCRAALGLHLAGHDTVLARLARTELAMLAAWRSR
ncbi:MAG: hypothetical protein JJE52_06310 [Acidimicrobiia bacterium]|nr:hypothetical protein [Acidimicrobiia bacterium]